MELDSSKEVESNSVQQYHKRNCCRRGSAFRSKWVRNKGTILVLIWSFLGSGVYHYLTMTKQLQDWVKKSFIFSGGELMGIAVMLPIGGWLADAYFGRYRVIRCGMWIMWVGAMLNGLSLMVGKIVDWYSTTVDPWISLASKVMMGVGLGAFQANVVQFGIDQLIDASSTEVIAFIMWYTILATFLSGNVIYYSGDCNSTYVIVLVIALFLTLMVCLNALFNKWLNKEQITSNPLSQILKVVYYTVKSRRRAKIAVRLEQTGVLSRFNIAKRVYNGPFTDEQVEDVKTFFRMMVVAVTFAISCSGIPTVIVFMQNLEKNLKYSPIANVNCYAAEFISYFTFTFPLVIVPTYKILIEPLFCSCLPTVKITTNFYFSVLLLLAGVLGLLGIESASYYHQIRSNETVHKCVVPEQDYQQASVVGVYWVLLPSALIGMSTYLLIVSGIQFICAQAPLNMKGLILGLSFALYGLMSWMQSVLSIPFVGSSKYIASWQKAPLTCGMWYLIVEGTIVLAGFLVVIVMVKTYKRRKRLSLLSQRDFDDSLPSSY